MASSDLDVRHKLALSWAYDVPKVKTENRVLKGVLDGYQLGSVFLAQTGQPVTLQSGVDSNANGDSAGDRVVFNPNGVGNTGTDVFAVCEAVTGTASGSPVGRVYVGTVGFTSAATNGCAVNNNPNTAQNTFLFDPAIGYTPIDKNAKYAVAGLGVRTTVGRNSLTTPGFGCVEPFIGKEVLLRRGKISARQSGCL